ncbi:MAG: DASS family sodium-coupled anion symporter [Planctomycetota bacterium]
MHSDTREAAKRLLGALQFSQVKSLTLTLTSALIAAGIAFTPTYTGLEPAGQWALWILVFSALMWVTEAIPPFATSLVSIGLMIAILGRPGGVFATTDKDWEMFIRPWGSSLIWLFFGGFVLAAGAARTGLDRWMALRTLGLFGKKPAMVLMGVMLITAVLSMFVSNTATATLMLAVLGPIINPAEGEPRRRFEDAAAEPDPQLGLLSKGLLLGIALAANIGGMGTIIGTPPNAIAAGVLADEGAGIDFARWMVLAVPPAAALLAVGWGFLLARYLGGSSFVDLESFSLGETRAEPVPKLRQVIVAFTFSATVLMWMTSPLTGIPTTVVSFLPICMLTATGILSADDIRRLPWDILLLITGGLSLGVAIDQTGLADWVVGQLPTDDLPLMAIVLGFGYLTLVLSNLMSNTATANIVLPLAVAILAATDPGDARLIVPVALSASLAMCLPISTPPNAIIYGSGQIGSLDLLLAGLVVGVIGPVVATLWCWNALAWV